MKRPFNRDGIPEELTQISNWVLHKDKIPLSANYEGRAKTNDPKTWASFDKAYSVYEARSKTGSYPDTSTGSIIWYENTQYYYDGLGFVVSDDSGVIFIDIDHCVDEEGNLDNRARDIINAFSEIPFVEISQSGTGLHILVYGTIPRSFKNSKNGVEMYSDKRSCDLTGHILYEEGKKLVRDPDAVKYIFEKYKTPEKVIIDRPLTVERALDISDSHIIEKARENPKTGHTFSLLWEGNYSSLYESHSEADLVLCQILAFWCDRDFRRIDNIFRSSGLYREKWEQREDYRTRTIQTAISNCRTSIFEYVNQKQREEVAELEKCFLSE